MEHYFDRTIYFYSFQFAITVLNRGVKLLNTSSTVQRAAKGIYVCIYHILGADDVRLDSFNVENKYFGSLMG
jgi:hypothetical protein